MLVNDQQSPWGYKYGVHDKHDNLLTISCKHMKQLLYYYTQIIYLGAKPEKKTFFICKVFFFLKNVHKQSKIKVAHPQIARNHNNNFYKIWPFICLPPRVTCELLTVKMSSP